MKKNLVAAVHTSRICTSSDSGLSWSPRESGRNWLSVASSANGSRLAAVAFGGQIYTSVSSTTPGPVGSLIGGSDAAIELQYVGNGQFRVLSFASTMIAE